MDHEEDLPDTDLLEQAQSHFSVGRDLVALVAARTRTRELNTSRRRHKRQGEWQTTREAPPATEDAPRMRV